MQKADHSGHRARLREKYVKFGIEALAPHEIIEMLLFNAVPYRNTNDIAKHLLDRFGSLSEVLDAPIELLMAEGLTQNQATFLKLIPDVTRQYMLDKHDNPVRILDPDAIARYLADKFIGLEKMEQVFVLLVDEKYKEVYSGWLSKGSFSVSEISIRRLMSLVLNYGAYSVILAHNHPSGMAIPSQADYRATVRIQEVLGQVGVGLYDHYIVADHEVVSMRDSGLLD